MWKHRHRLSYADTRVLWSWWKHGQTLEVIATALGMSTSGSFAVIRARGGIMPAPRCRSPRSLTARERDLIAASVRAGRSMRAMARQLARSPSTISRELARNGARTAGSRHYQAAVADARAWMRAARPKPSKLAQNPRLCRLVAAKLRLDWSPRQIVCWLMRTFPDDPTRHLAAETIYRTLYVQTKATLRKELLTHLRRGGAMRRVQGRPSGAGRIRDAVSIAERPPESDDRRVPGHWEGDLLMGANQSQIVTLVERSSRYVLLIRVPNKETLTVTRALARRIKRLPERLKASLAWDRGTELAAHKQFTLATDMAVYFADPHSPWQRGTNENTNGLLRQYFPHGMDLSAITQRQLNAVELRLNTRPRETLGFDTPAAVYNSFLLNQPVASIG